MNDDFDLDPIDETAKPVLSDSELSDVDEGAYIGIDTTRLDAPDSDDEGPNVWALKPAKLKTGTGERRKGRVEDTEERRRIRQERRQKKEEARKRKIISREVEDETPQVDPDQRPEDPEAARRWDLDRAMDAAISKKQAKRKKRNDEIVIPFKTSTNFVRTLKV